MSGVRGGCYHRALTVHRSACADLASLHVIWPCCHFHGHCSVTLSALREETSLIFDPSWPSPICPRGKEHELVEYAPGWVCDRCGGPIKRADAMALLGWWQRIHVTMSESWPQN